MSDLSPQQLTADVWVIRVCRCGFPLGATRAAMRLKTCPDCGAPTIPVEDVTRSVTVAERRRLSPMGYEGGRG